MLMKQITENSFFLNDGNITIGILIKQGNSYLFLNPKEQITYNSLDEIEKVHGKLIYDTKNFEKSKVTTIKDYPVRHANAESFEFEGFESLPTYKTGGNTIYAGGHWTLRVKEDGRFGITWCPKLTTLLEGTYFGPFKNRLDALQEANIQNQRLERILIDKMKDTSNAS